MGEVLTKFTEVLTNANGAFGQVQTLVVLALSFEVAKFIVERIKMHDKNQGEISKRRRSPADGIPY